MIDKTNPSKKRQPSSTLLFDHFELDVLKLLKRHRWHLVIGLLLGWVVTAIYYLLVPPTYESQAHLLLQPKNPAVEVRGLANGRETASTLSDDLLATHMMLIQSPEIVKVALKKANMEEAPSLLAAKGEKSVVDYTIDRLSVSRGGEGKAKNAQVLRLSMRHNDPEDVEKIVKAIVSEFQAFIDKKYVDVNQDAAELIESAQNQLKSDLEVAEVDFRKFRENAPIVWSGDQGTNIYRAEFEQIESTLTDLRMSRAEIASRLELVDEQLNSINENHGSDLQKLALVDEKHAERIAIFLEIYGGKAETQLFQSQQPERLEAARSEYEGLLTLKAKERTLALELGDEHTKVREVREQIKSVEQFLEARTDKLRIQSETEETFTAGKLVDAYVSLLKHDISALDEREKRLIAQSKQSQEQARTLAQYELEGEQLRLAVGRQRDLFEATIDRLRDINMAKDFGGFVNELIKVPELGKEVWPVLPICMVLGTLGGLILGGLSAVIADFRNQSIRSVKDVEVITGSPAISMVPRLVEHRSAKARSRISESGSSISPIVSTFHRPRSQESEVFRGLRTSLIFKMGTIKAKVLAVTSPTSGDGKSTVLSNVAISLAQAGRRVLLVDADMRRPNIGKIFGCTGTRGLAELLAGDGKAADYVVQTECPTLEILPAGEIPGNPSELLSSHGLKELILKFKEEYDFVLVDCPPVLAVADPCIVSGVVDAVAIVLRVNPQSKIELKRSIEMLEDVEANVLGTIVNASRIESVEGGKSDDYGVGYGYGTYGGRSNSYYSNSERAGSKK